MHTPKSRPRRPANSPLAKEGTDWMRRRPNTIRGDHFVRFRRCWCSSPTSRLWSKRLASSLNIEASRFRNNTLPARSFFTDSAAIVYLSALRSPLSILKFCSILQLIRRINKDNPYPLNKCKHKKYFPIVRAFPCVRPASPAIAF